MRRNFRNRRGIKRTAFFVHVFLLTTAAYITVPVFPAAGVSEKSKELNNRGMAMYEEGDYTGASELFVDAIEADYTNFLAHYNLACAMALLRKQYNPCDFDPEGKQSFDIRIDSILKSLRTAAELNSGRKRRMLEDPDLNAVHTALEFHLIAGRSLNTAADARIILQEVLWRIDFAGRPAGLNTEFGLPDGTVAFAPNGTFRIEFYEYGSQGFGRYRVENGRLELDFTGGDLGKGRIYGTFEEDRIVVTGFEKGPLLIWSDTSEYPAQEWKR
jgi:hypothetical protein